MTIFKDAKYWKAKYKKLYHQMEDSFEILHRTICKYQDGRKYFLDKTREYQDAIDKFTTEAEKYKRLYADELQKRLELAAIVEAIENGKDN